MSFQIPDFIFVLLCSICLAMGAVFENPRHPGFRPGQDNLSTDPISVRESVTELQVSVGDRIFVFGKAKGTLEKVKVGMHVLHFSQVPGALGSGSVVDKVNWRKLRDGSIRIQSNYSPWPGTLTWTVLTTGQLMLEASAPPVTVAQSSRLGLGFNFPNGQLRKVSWQAGGGNSEEASGQWENAHYLPSSNSYQRIEADSSFFSQQFQTLKLEFESITVDAKTDTPGFFFEMRSTENQGSNFQGIYSDLGFLFDLSRQRADFLPPAPSENNPKTKSVPLNPLVLWFHFQ